MDKLLSNHINCKTVEKPIDWDKMNNEKARKDAFFEYHNNGDTVMSGQIEYFNAGYDAREAEIDELIKTVVSEVVKSCKALTEIEKLKEENKEMRGCLENIANHNTLDGEKYNNYSNAYQGVVQYAKEFLDKINKR